MGCEFRLVDLGSQARAVAAYSRRWTPLQLLDWLARFGTLTPSPRDPGVFLWQNGIGLRSAVTFRSDGTATVQEWTGGFRPDLAECREVPLHLAPPELG